MTTITFDTLEFVQTLREADVPEKQAQATANAFKAAQGSAELATKADLKEVKGDFKAEINQLRHEIHEMEQRMTIRLGGMLVVAVTVIVGLIKII